jgi:hypothetical protein
MDYRPDPRRPWLTMARRAIAVAALLWAALFLWTYHSSDRYVGRATPAEFYRTFAPPGR